MKAAGIALALALSLLGCSDDESDPAANAGAGGQGGSDDPFSGTWSTGIFAAEMDGSAVRALWKGNEVLAALEVAPGGDRLAMVRFPPGAASHDFAVGAIAILDLGAAQPEPVVAFDAEGADVLPSWSPAGDRLVFVSQCAGFGAGAEFSTVSGADHRPTDLYLLDVASGAVERLTTTDEQSEGDPHWASEELIIFTRVNPDTHMPEVWSHNLTNGNEKRITEPPPVTEPFDPPWGPGDFDPHLNPEGTLIAFERHKDTSWGVWGLPIGDFDVLVLDLTDGGATHAPDDTHDADIRPVWARGGWLAFYRGYEEHGTDTTDVWVMKHDGSVKMNITSELPVANETWPHWIPAEQPPEVDGVADLVFMAHPYVSPCESWCAQAEECGKSDQYAEGCMAWCRAAYGGMVGSVEACAACLTSAEHSCDELFPDPASESGVCHQSCL